MVNAKSPSVPGGRWRLQQAVLAPIVVLGREDGAGSPSSAQSPRRDGENTDRAPKPRREEEPVPALRRPDASSEVISVSSRR